MKKSEAPAFAEFMQTEAVRYSRDLQMAEIQTWFETFKRSPMDEFKLAWEQHRREPKRGMYFPTINDLMRTLRVVGSEQAKRDWRCEAEESGLRCNYPGALSKGTNGGGPWYCSAHFRLLDHEFTQAAVKDDLMQIIERSQSYRPPATYDELYRLNDARRAGAKRQSEVHRKRLAADPLPVSMPSQDGPPLEDIPLPEETPAEYEPGAFG